MTTMALLVRAGGNDFIGFIVFIIIVTVINRLKSVAEGGNKRKQQNKGTYAAPRRELEEFLKGLTEQTSPPAVTPVPPPPTPSRAQVGRAAPPPAPVLRTVEQKPVARQPVPVKVAAPMAPVRRKSRSHRESSVMSWLSNGSTLRQSVIVREVLGPPVALSHQQKR